MLLIEKYAKLLFSTAKHLIGLQISYIHGVIIYQLVVWGSFLWYVFKEISFFLKVTWGWLKLHRSDKNWFNGFKSSLKNFGWLLFPTEWRPKLVLAPCKMQTHWALISFLKVLLSYHNELYALNNYLLKLFLS